MPRIRRDLEVLGTYTNSDGKTKDVFLRWNEKKGGYIIYDAKTNKVMLPTAFSGLGALPKQFKDSGERRDLALK